MLPRSLREIEITVSFDLIRRGSVFDHSRSVWLVAGNGLCSASHCVPHMLLVRHLIRRSGRLSMSRYRARGAYLMTQSTAPGSTGVSVNLPSVLAASASHPLKPVMPGLEEPGDHHHLR